MEAYWGTFPLIKKHHEHRPRGRGVGGGTSGHSAAFYSHPQSILSFCNDMYPCFYDMAVKRDSWDRRPWFLHLLAGELLRYAVTYLPGSQMSPLCGERLCGSMILLCVWMHPLLHTLYLSRRHSLPLKTDAKCMFLVKMKCLFALSLWQSTLLYGNVFVQTYFS